MKTLKMILVVAFVAFAAISCSVEEDLNDFQGQTSEQQVEKARILELAEKYGVKVEVDNLVTRMGDSKLVSTEELEELFAGVKSFYDGMPYAKEVEVPLESAPLRASGDEILGFQDLMSIGVLLPNVWAGYSYVSNLTVSGRLSITRAGIFPNQYIKNAKLEGDISGFQSKSSTYDYSWSSSPYMNFDRSSAVGFVHFPVGIYLTTYTSGGQRVRVEVTFEASVGASYYNGYSAQISFSATPGYISQWPIEPVVE